MGPAREVIVGVCSRPHILAAGWFRAVLADLSAVFGEDADKCCCGRLDPAGL